MTEEEWWDCKPSELDEMLTYLREKQVSTRKVWLFVCACCRGIWPLLTDQRSRAAVEVAERYVDDLVPAKALEEARNDVGDVLAERGETLALSIMAHRVTLAEVSGNPWVAASSVCSSLLDPSWRLERFRFTKKLSNGQRRAIFDVSARLRDIFGPLPFRPVSIDQTVLEWNDGTVPKVAQVIYEERDFDQLPILADALEEAGCANEEILRHCRDPQTHSRGCWCVDLVLGNR